MKDIESFEKTVSFIDEPLILVDQHDKIIGHEIKDTCHQGEGKLHRAFSIFLLDSQNRLILQKRSSSKLLWPGFWTNSCCSHPRQGEDLNFATQRRLQEELGLSCELEYDFNFIYQAKFKNIGSEHELCHVFYGKTLKDPQPNIEEIEDLKFIDLKDMDRWVEEDPTTLTPWFLLEWPKVKKSLLALT